MKLKDKFANSSENKINYDLFRNKIIWMTFFLSILVIWTHAYNAVLFLGTAGKTGLYAEVEVFISESISQIAVPGFFLVSSFLYFRTYNSEQLTQKWNRRLHSIVIPYFLWNGLYYIGYCIASRSPWLGDVVGKGVIPFNLREIFFALFQYKYNYVFWYEFQLILLIIMSPGIHVIVKDKIATIVYIFILAVIIELRIDLFLVNADALFYYSLAAYMAVNHKHLVEAYVLKRGEILGIILLLLSVVLYIYGARYGHVLCIVVSRTMGPAGIWFAVHDKWLKPAYGFMKNSFMVYVMHFAIVRFINKTAAKIWPKKAITGMILFIIMPVIVIMIIDIIVRIMRRYIPWVYRLLSGNR